MKTYRLILAFIFLYILPSHAQQQGLVPFMTYDASNFDNISLDWGTVVLNIPIVSYTQKGSLPPVGLKFVYNTPSWSQAMIVQTYGLPGLPQTYNDYYWVFNNPLSNYVDSTNTLLTFTPFLNMDPFGFQDGQNSTNGDSTYLPTVTDDTGAVHAMYAVYSPATGPTGTFESTDLTGISSPGKCGGTGAGAIDRNGVSYWYGPCFSSFPRVLMQDTNGNNVVVSRTGLTDSVGRSIPFISGSGAAPSQAPQCVSQNYPSVGATTAPITVCRQLLTATSNFQIQPYNESSYTFAAITSIALPNGTSWQFGYDSWGFLNSVTLPTGAVVSYTWGTDPVDANLGPRRIHSRSVSSDNLQTKTYAYQTNGQTTVTDAMGNQIVYSPGGSSIQYIDAKLGLQKTVGKNWNNSIVVTTLANGQVSKSCTIYDNDPNTDCSGTKPLSTTGLMWYDPNFVDNPARPLAIPYSLSLGTPIHTYVYDYGDTHGSQGPLLRATTNTYRWQANNTNNSYFSANLLNLLSSSSISGGGGALATTSYAYDETTNGSPSGVHGNQTSVIRSLLDGTSPKSQVGYNSQGMPTIMIDPNNNTTLITYDGTGLYPSQIQYPTTNNGVEHNEWFSYDANTGLMMSRTAQNGQATTYSYDSMGRVIGISYPDGGTTTTSYAP